MKIAILDDYQQAALHYADWSALQKQADVVLFHKPFEDGSEAVRQLKDFTVICAMRERTPFPSAVLRALPELKLIVSTGKRNAAIDQEACKSLGIEVRFTGYHETGAPELTWGLLLNLARHITAESQHMRQNEWQQTIGVDLAGKTIGIVGLGRIGSTIARYAKAFGMKLIAWSENLTEERAHRAGAELVTKEQLFKRADFITLHLVLSERSKNTVTAKELAIMKPTAYLINTSRGPLLDEAALIHALTEKHIAGAALDVYDAEPLAPEHPFRTLPNVLATPHIGYVTEDTYRIFYGDTVKEIEAWILEQTHF